MSWKQIEKEYYETQENGDFGNPNLDADRILKFFKEHCVPKEEGFQYYKVDHVCCFNDPSNKPPCGIDKHTQCCLCREPNAVVLDKK